MSADAPHYEYKFEDNSILLAVLEKSVFVPVVRVIPRGLTPNQITIAGQLAAVSAFVIALLVQPMTKGALVTLVGAILFSTLADCVDGLYARHSRQTSRLGELLDHWLDGITVPMIGLSLGLALSAAPWACFAAVLAVSFQHFATFLHGFRVGYVRLGRIGMIEAATIASAVSLAVVIMGFEPLTRPLVGGLSFVTLLLLAIVAGAFSALFAMRGLLRHLRDFKSIVILLTALALWYAFGRVSPALAGFCVIMIGSYLEGHIIRARLLRVPVMLNDAGLLALTLLGTAGSLALNLEARTQSWLMGAVALYALLRESRAFWQTVTILRSPAPVATAGATAHASLPS